MVCYISAAAIWVLPSLLRFWYSGVFVKGDREAEVVSECEGAEGIAKFVV